MSDEGPLSLSLLIRCSVKKYGLNMLGLEKRLYHLKLD